MAAVKVGDRVVIGVSCPQMIVEHFEPVTNRASCIWFDDEQHLQRDTFPLQILKVLREPPTVD